jgi:Ca2+-binding RTX toxin-like protein
VTLTGFGLMGLATGTIYWVPSSAATGGVTYLKIMDGSAGSTFVVTDTPNLFFGIDLNTGSGNDLVYISGTTGSLNVNNSDGYDSVYVGSSGTLANVNGAVNVSGNGSIYLYIEDYLDTTSHTATLTATSLTGLSGGAIRWVPTVAATGGVTFLSITGSAAGSIYNVTDTPNLYYYTELNTGAGDDLVNITGTTDGLYLYNAGGNDNVHIGNGSVSGINGFVYVSGAGSTSLYVLDDNDTVSRNVTLTATTLTGLSAGTIYWNPSAASTGGVTYLVIDGSAAASTYTVTDTPNLRFSTTLTTGTGNDTVILIGGDARDTIIGGSGRSLLIGGKGADTITGSADDDILIGGYTSYGSAWHEAELMSILAEWQSADSYSTRISTLRFGSSPLALGTTVLDDGGTDKLTGGAGMDWFFAGIHNTITDYQGGEVVN